MSERSGRQWQVRGMMEDAGLRVVTLHVFPERPYRWSVRVLAEDSTEKLIRTLTGLDVVRYWRLPGVPGEPDEYVVTVDQPVPAHAGRRRRMPSQRRQGGPGRWSQG